MDSVSAPTTQQPCKIIASTLVAVTINAGLTYLGARILTSINPMAGLIFGATVPVGGCLTGYLAKQCDNNPFAKTAIKVVGFLASIKLGALTATAAGYPLTFASAFILYLTSGVLLVGGSICLFAVPAVVIIGIKACKEHTSFCEAAKNLTQSIKNFADNAARTGRIENPALPT